MHPWSQTFWQWLIESKCSSKMSLLARRKTKMESVGNAKQKLIRNSAASTMDQTIINARIFPLPRNWRSKIQ